MSEASQEVKEAQDYRQTYLVEGGEVSVQKISEPLSVADQRKLADEKMRADIERQDAERKAKLAKRRILQEAETKKRVVVVERAPIRVFLKNDPKDLNPDPFRNSAENSLGAVETEGEKRVDYDLIKTSK